MANAYGAAAAKFQRIAQIDHALTFLQWDQLVMMPPGGNDARAESIAELSSLHHEMLTSREVGDLIAEARKEESESGRLRSISEMEREWQRAICLPADLVKAQSLAGSKCEHGWREQRPANDWSGFLDNFREVVRLSREEAQARMEAASENIANPYDALLDYYCAGDSSEFIGELYSELKNALPELLSRVLDHQSGTSCADLSGEYPEGGQKKLNIRLMETLGFDFKSGRLDLSMHPFSTGDRGDHRITTRFRADECMDGLMATAHETGHASYEHGLPKEWAGLPIGKSNNMCIHESQSLLFEKQLFLSRQFLSFFTSEIHSIFPHTKKFSAKQVWSACTRVQPDLIRVDADEVTYPLHVMLRFEIERDLINGTLEAQDIPEVWDDLMQRYLGISTAGNYTDGCLQDIHWTDGSFGYFPSYTIGALNAAQLFAAIRKEHEDWRVRLEAGDTAFVRNWLAEKIWKVGRTRDSQDIILAATGEGTNPKFFLEHIRERYLQEAY